MITATRSRDFQRQRVYDAEHCLRRVLKTGGSIEMHNSTLEVPIELTLGNLDGVREYYRHVEAQDWYKQRWPLASALAVEAKAGIREQGAYCLGVVRLTPDSNHTHAEHYVLHEMAHHLTRGDGHGPKFAGVYAYLLGKMLGPVAQFIIEDCYRNCGVLANTARIHLSYP